MLDKNHRTQVNIKIVIIYYAKYTVALRFEESLKQKKEDKA